MEKILLLHIDEVEHLEREVDFWGDEVQYLCLYTDIRQILWLSVSVSFLSCDKHHRLKTFDAQKAVSKLQKNKKQKDYSH